MQSLNQVISILILLLYFCTIQNTKAQIIQELPEEFFNVPINSKALEKNLKVTIDKNTSKTVQNYALDKTGYILHLKPAPQIKDENTKIRIFSNESKETEIFKFIKDKTIFSLVNPDSTYFIVQENKIKCDELIKKLNIDAESTICPDLIAYKILENIMISNDTSFKLPLRSPLDFYLLPLSLPENTVQFDAKFKITEIKINDKDTESEATSINISNLLSLGESCIIGTTKLKSNKNTQNQLRCKFENKNTQSIAYFKNDLKNKLLPGKNLNLLIPLLSNFFNKFNQFYLFEYFEDVKSNNPHGEKVEINKKSQNKLLFESHNSTLRLNLGQISTLNTRIKKNTYSINNPIIINKALSKHLFEIPLTQQDVIINPFTDTNIDSVLTNVSLEGKEKLSLNSFNISIDNNISLKNSFEPKEETTTTTLAQLAQTEQGQEDENVTVQYYLPDGVFDLLIMNTYSHIEQNIAPSVDEKGKPIEIINNKSLGNLISSKSVPKTDISGISSINIDLEKPDDFIIHKQFKNQFGLSGFLIPPDFRPVLEPFYRATIQASMIINISNNDTLKITYFDLKTKDEIPLTNFFQFSFLPEGEYDLNIRFDTDRYKLFESAGIVEVRKDEE